VDLTVFHQKGVLTLKPAWCVFAVKDDGTLVKSKETIRLTFWNTESGASMDKITHGVLRFTVVFS